MRVAGFCLSFLLVMVTLLRGPAPAGELKALVIGNSNYWHANRLANPRHDAMDMANLLSSLGFNVRIGLDLKRSEMESRIQFFSDALFGADLGLFFYAGHALTIQGRNYLLPVDVQPNSEANLEQGLIDLDIIQTRMEIATETNVLFIDACRNNPLTPKLSAATTKNRRRIGVGLAPRPNTGTLISYSAQPGRVAIDGEGRNSPYTSALLRNLMVPNLDLAAVLTRVRKDVKRATHGAQIPWDLSSVVAPIKINFKSATIKKARPVLQGGFSDKTLELIMKYAWEITPAKFTDPDGTVVNIDKGEPEAIFPSLDVARDIVFAGRRSAHAMRCSLDNQVASNHRALMDALRQAGRWTEPQLAYFNQLHLMTVLLLRGKITVGGTLISEPAATCNSAMRVAVKHGIEAYTRQLR